jgi:hypothetical protein
MQIPSDIRTYQARRAAYTGPRGPWLEYMVEDVDMSIEEAVDMLGPYELIPVKDGAGQHIGTVLKRNKEVHFAFYRKYRMRRLITRELIDTYLAPMLRKNGYLVTKVADDEHESERFIVKLGFELIGSTMGGFRTFILNEIRYPGQKHEHI